MGCSPKIQKCLFFMYIIVWYFCVFGCGPFVWFSVDAVPCEETMKKVKVKRVNRFEESTDIYTEFFKPYELTSFDDTFCIAMTNSAR